MSEAFTMEIDFEPTWEIQKYPDGLYIVGPEWVYRNKDQSVAAGLLERVNSGWRPEGVSPDSEVHSSSFSLAWDVTGWSHEVRCRFRIKQKETSYPV